MTPEREREIRRIAGRDGLTWRSSAVSLFALNEVLDELERIRTEIRALPRWESLEDSSSALVPKSDGELLIYDDVLDVLEDK